MVTCITPTGDRFLALDLCRKWIFNQTMHPDLHVIVDDGKVPSFIGNLKPYEMYVRREPKLSDPKHTLVVNVDFAMKYLKEGKVFFIEDDEYYSPDYISIMSKQLDMFDFVGIGCSKYYHLPTGGWQQHLNMDHASLAQTCFNMSYVDLVSKCVSKGMSQNWLDDNIWREVRKSKSIKSCIFKDEVSLYCGMKGLPGRAGIGIGHNLKVYKNHDSQDRVKLKEWVLKDYTTYISLLKGA